MTTNPEWRAEAENFLRDGNALAAVRAYRHAHPSASLEEAKRVIFAMRDDIPVNPPTAEVTAAKRAEQIAEREKGCKAIVNLAIMAFGLDAVVEQVRQLQAGEVPHLIGGNKS